MLDIKSHLVSYFFLNTFWKMVFKDPLSKRANEPFISRQKRVMLFIKAASYAEIDQLTRRRLLTAGR